MTSPSAKNPRWLAHCHAINQDPDINWCGGVGAEFIIWTQERVVRFGEDHPEHVFKFENGPPGICNQDAFTAYLWECARKERKEHDRSSNHHSSE